MIAIKNGKRYDTEKAEQIATNQQCLVGTNCKFYSSTETLLKTMNKRYFLYCIVSSHPIECNAVESIISSEIRPLKPIKALDWLEEIGNTEIIEQEFSDIIEEA